MEKRFSKRSLPDWTDLQSTSPALVERHHEAWDMQCKLLSREAGASSFQSSLNNAKRLKKDIHPILKRSNYQYALKCVAQIHPLGQEPGKQ